MRARLFFATLFLALLAAHLCHDRILWAEEDLPLAAARQMLLGKALYRGIWFDKPPLVPLVYLLWGARIGFVLRVFGTLYAFACCLAAWFFARDVWGRQEAFWAASLLGFVLTFGTPSAVIPLAADLLLLLPHLASLWLAYRKQPFWSGLCAGIGFLTNVKAALVVVACALFAWPALIPLGIGFVLPILAAAALLAATGSWPAYWDQVWIWPALYAGSSHVPDPLWNGFVRTANWVGFQASLVVAAIYALFRTEAHNRWRWIAWAGLSFAGVALGARFFPRYFFLLVPVVVLLAARGFVLLRPPARWVVLALLLIPAIRFGPRYALLAGTHSPAWPDTAMDADSQAAAGLIAAAAHPGDTLYVWGYRPDIFVYTGLPAASRYLDSQAMTGVPADRHLTQSEPVTTAGTAAARRELALSTPTFIADGLSLYNPSLSMDHYPELRPWLARYREFSRTPDTILYRLR